MRPSKAVFPVAGLGTRFLPATKANPKEMLALVDKPLIQYAVEEAVRAGITHMIFITNSSKRAIEDHFDNHYELESRLLEQGKEQLLDLVRSVSPPGIHFSYVRQHQPLGLGHAVLAAEHVVGNEPFAVLLADDFIEDHNHPCLSAMAEHFQAKPQSIFAVQEVPLAQVSQYGVVAVDNANEDYSLVRSIVEKPKVEEALSNLVVVGRYIFTPRIFSALKTVKPDHRGEIQLTDAIAALLQQDEVYAYQFTGKRYDCGSKLGYMQASVELALRHPDIGREFREYLSLIDKGYCRDN